MEYSIKVTKLKKYFRWFKSDWRVFIWLFTRKGYEKEFKVLDGISFNVKPGERVGILGKNGAGKSTLLKIICSIYWPSSGTVEVDGTIASLIELGAGFRDELTGRENIYMKGALMGLSKEFLDGIMPNIIEFADIGEYFDMPIGTYSSGMRARVGFALAVNTDADILIIDEVFAVGDRNFQIKSRAKTEELLKSGKTVLFVSHSASLIEEFCERVIYLKDGKIAYDGPTKRGLNIYESDNLSLERVPTVSYSEYEIIQDEIKFRFEYGIGVQGNVIKPYKYDHEFEFFSTGYDTRLKSIFGYDIFDFRVDFISNEIVDIYINIQEITDGSDHGFAYTNKYMNEARRNVTYTGQDISDALDNYLVFIRNINGEFVFNVTRNDNPDQNLITD